MTVMWRTLRQSISSWSSMAIRSPSNSDTTVHAPRARVPGALLGELVRPDRHPLEASLAVGRHHRDVDRVASPPHRDAADAGDVVARVEGPPALAEPDLEPGV